VRTIVRGANESLSPWIVFTAHAVQLMNEILRGIRVVKMYAWESNFLTKITTLRAAELHSLKGRKYLDALCVYFWATTPVLISILSFGTFVLTGGTLTPSNVFTR
jgi:ATP-binding cassette, subfamily C (CFTR/MRP), member 10